MAIIGNYNIQSPTPESIFGLDLLLAMCVERNYLTSNFTLVALCEYRPFASPGRQLYDKIIDTCRNGSPSASTYSTLCNHLVSVRTNIICITFCYAVTVFIYLFIYYKNGRQPTV